MATSTLPQTTITDHTDPMIAQAGRWNAGYRAYVDGLPLEDCTGEDMCDGWHYARKGELYAGIADTAAYLGQDMDLAIARYADTEAI